MNAYYMYAWIRILFLLKKLYPERTESYYPTNSINGRILGIKRQRKIVRDRFVWQTGTKTVNWKSFVRIVIFNNFPHRLKWVSWDDLKAVLEWISGQIWTISMFKWNPDFNCLYVLVVFISIFIFTEKQKLDIQTNDYAITVSPRNKLLQIFL